MSYGGLGVCESESLGVWESGSLGVWESESLGVCEFESLKSVRALPAQRRGGPWLRRLVRLVRGQAVRRPISGGSSAVELGNNSASC